MSPDWTVRDLINFMNIKCRQDLGLENVDLVPSQHSNCYLGQYNSYENLRVEEGPRLSMETIDDGNRLLKDVFGQELDVFFYIRSHIEPLELVESLENIPIVSAAAATTSAITGRTCSICTTREVNLLFLPCRHLACCSECGMNPTVNSCHICRETISERIVVYMN